MAVLRDSDGNRYALVPLEPVRPTSSESSKCSPECLACLAVLVYLGAIVALVMSVVPGTTWLDLSGSDGACTNQVATYSLNDLIGVVSIAGGDLTEMLRGLLATGAALQLCFLLGLLALKAIASSDGNKLTGAWTGCAICLVSCFGIMCLVMVAVVLGLWNANFSAVLDAACPKFCHIKYQGNSQLPDYCGNNSNGVSYTSGYTYAAFAIAVFSCCFCTIFGGFFAKWASHD